MKFSSTINQLKLPLLMSVEQPPQIKYTPPGNLNVTARRFCGDGDVANFASRYPNFQFVPSNQPKLDVIVGYWIVENGSSDILPNRNNWFPIVYKKVDIAANNTSTTSEGGRFLPFNHSTVGPNVNGLDLIRNELVNVYNTATKSYLSQKDYNLYAAVLSCVDPDYGEEMTIEGQAPYKPSPIEIINSLGQFESVVSDSLNGLLDEEKISKMKKLLIESNPAALQNSQNPKPYKYSFGEEGLNLENTELFKIFKDIMRIQYPQGQNAQEQDLESFKASLSNEQVKSRVSGFTGDKINFCNSLGATTSGAQKSFDKLEPFILNLTCKNLYLDTALGDAYRNLFNPSEKPNPNTFDNLKKNLAKRFLVAAGYQVAQEHFNNNIFITRTGCFNRPGQNSIGRIVASYPLKFEFSSTPSGGKYILKTNSYNHLHPESLFAISDFSRYFQNNFLAIFGQVQPSQGTTDLNVIRNSNSIALPLSNQPLLESKPVNNQSFDGVPLNINFKVRSVGGNCNGTIYC